MKELDRSTLLRALEVVEGVGSARQAWLRLTEAGLVGPKPAWAGQRWFTPAWRRTSSEFDEAPALDEVPPSLHTCLSLAASSRGFAAAEALAQEIVARWPGWVDESVRAPWTLVWQVLPEEGLDTDAISTDCFDALLRARPLLASGPVLNREPGPMTFGALHARHLEIVTALRSNLQAAEAAGKELLPACPLDPIEELLAHGYVLGDVWIHGDEDGPTIVLFAPGVPEIPAVTETERNYLWSRCTHPTPMVEALFGTSTRDELAEVLLALSHSIPWGALFVEGGRSPFSRHLEQTAEQRALYERIADEKVTELRWIAAQLQTPDEDWQDSCFQEFWDNLHTGAVQEAELASLFCTALRARWPTPPAAASCDALRPHVSA
ncbi:MAG: hypothetical protein MUF64_06775 [Polyangiaceae bacterium]|jgi:hypothetical protein|nr:hypothetical protein [Polyangiaceae bacterium]